MVAVTCETRCMMVLVTWKNRVKCVDLTCGRFCLPGEVWQCLKIFLVVTVWTGFGLGGNCIGVSLGEAEDAAQCHTTHTKSPHNRG